MQFTVELPDSVNNFNNTAVLLLLLLLRIVLFSTFYPVFLAITLCIHRLGLDPKLLAKILNMSSGRCWSSDTYNPVPGVMEGVPSANNYQGGFGTTLMAKVCFGFNTFVSAMVSYIWKLVSATD